MPELPEVETLRRDLQREVTGRRIDAVSVTGARTVRRPPGAAQLCSGLAGRQVTRVVRRGKYLLWLLAPAVAHCGTGGEGAEVLVVHLGMSGQLLLVQDGDDPAPPHTHLRMDFVGGGEVRFVDPRTFGQCWLSRECGSGEVPELAHLGFEPLDDPEGAERLAKGLGATRRRLKELLMDQSFVAGIGNIYSDEILHAAQLRWDRPGASLGPGEVARLYGAMVATLGLAIEMRGSSLADAQYRDLSGVAGSFQSRHRVYARAGQACASCGGTITRVRFAGRSTFFCPCCQR